MVAAALTHLLTDDDPSPIEVVNAGSDVPLLLLCEHAGRAIPKVLGNLGVTPEVLTSHRAWDIGAEQVARGVAQALGAPLIVQRYSRLVIDANRPPDTPAAMPLISDGADVPANANLSPKDKSLRIKEIFQPMALAVEDAFAAHRRVATFSIHSFTRRFGGTDRPWHAGFLARQDIQTAARLRDSIAAAHPGLTMALNEPYQIEDATDWFIPVHAESRGLAHCLIEIRNDQIDHPKGARLWIDLLTGAISDVMERLA